MNPAFEFLRQQTRRQFFNGAGLALGGVALGLLGRRANAAPPKARRGGSSARRGGATRCPSAVVRCSIHRVVLVVYGVNMIDNTRRHQVRLVHVDLYSDLLLLLAIGLLVPL